jgi:outer membrane lipoprotein SlyB
MAMHRISHWTVHRRLSICSLLSVSLLLSACANQQQGGTAIGAAAGAVVGGLLGAATAKSPADRNAAFARGALAGAALGGIAGSAIGARLDVADRQRAEAAAARAVAERESAVQRALSVRNAEIERQLRADVASARSATERANAQARAGQAQELAHATVVAQTNTPPVSWSGTASGSAQVVGAAQVQGRSNCFNVREVAIIQGQEVRQSATYCPGANGQGSVRVA